MVDAKDTSKFVEQKGHDQWSYDNNTQVYGRDLAINQQKQT